jgi:DNA ligase-1
MFKPLLACNADLSKIRYPVYGSPKLDGIRCIVIDGKPMSRSLKVIPNRYIQEQFARYAEELEGLDGELIVGSATAKNVYNASVSGIMSQDGEPDFTYHVFDRIGGGDYLTRWLRSHDEFDRGVDFVNVLPSCRIDNEVELSEYELLSVAEGYEGIMLRDPTGIYKNGRSTVSEGILLKVKRFADSEATIIGFEERLHNTNEATTNALGRTERSSHQENMIGRGDLGAIIVKCADYANEFRIGTGFDDATRRLIWDNRSEWLGKLIKFKHQKSGEKDAPRFPVYLGLRSADDL